ncbi:hypothetical protein CAOG_06260 [Capsaspora owczarzaki ATCC 30864]|uniref:Glycosyltransferase 2-like domain-containing protein n=1 Tax=Capsaspora owczarzaki (strain ATCC 30864) TaxID=595528 RepID=A0A0D2VWC4_CAPO3|nr:hypothetical protein CAOG_06260 [Capsaspora owczarzaki ATCC 30864]KJE95857.1 hypothetical protein CAOG_006260 [Capsaspora owczarzaki ATCC 30864]|eukprot:XP_004345009.2 hypothetical protein CAOG_06260 [Capsaspora owczarzaki ATCC 30864]
MRPAAARSTTMRLVAFWLLVAASLSAVAEELPQPAPLFNPSHQRQFEQHGWPQNQFVMAQANGKTMVNNKVVHDSLLPLDALAQTARRNAGGAGMRRGALNVSTISYDVEKLGNQVSVSLAARVQATANAPGFDVLDANFQLVDLGFLAGVNMGSSKPGYEPGDGAANLNDFRRFMRYASTLGANVIRVYSIMPPVFYQALYEHNRAAFGFPSAATAFRPFPLNESTVITPLYVMQTVWGYDLTDEISAATTGSGTSQSINMFLPASTNIVRKAITDAVRAVYGAGEAPYGRKISGEFTYNISPYLIGWIFGSTWTPADIAKTNGANANVPRYNGQFFSCTTAASPFECWIAYMVDILAAEDTKRGWQRPIGIANAVETDPMTHALDPGYPYSENDWQSIEAANIVVSPPDPTRVGFYAGMFYSFDVQPGFPDFLAGIAPTPASEIPSNAPAGVNVNSDPYAAYIVTLRQRYPSAPLIVSSLDISTGILTARIDASLNRNSGGIDEQSAGTEIANLIKLIQAAGLNGVVLFELVDEWFKTTWNSEDATSHPEAWLNMLSASSNTGLVAASSPSSIIIDGNRQSTSSEWSNCTNMLGSSGTAVGFKSMCAQFDASQLFLLVEKSSDFQPGDSLWIAFDTVPGKGAVTSQIFYGPASGMVSYNIPADYLVNFDASAANSNEWQLNVYVNDNLDAYQRGPLIADAPYYDLPAASAGQDDSRLGYFSLIRSLTRKRTYLADPSVSGSFTAVDHVVTDLGRLQRGINYLYAPADDALASSMNRWHAVGSTLEVSLPWSMLGFIDPSKSVVSVLTGKGTGMQEHALETEEPGEISVQLVVNQQSLPPAKYRFGTWNKPCFCERFKPTAAFAAQAFYNARGLLDESNRIQTTIPMHCECPVVPGPGWMRLVFVYLMTYGSLFLLAMLFIAGVVRPLVSRLVPCLTGRKFKQTHPGIGYIQFFAFVLFAALAAAFILFGIVREQDPYTLAYDVASDVDADDAGRTEWEFGIYMVLLNWDAVFLALFCIFIRWPRKHIIPVPPILPPAELFAQQQQLLRHQQHSHHHALPHPDSAVGSSASSIHSDDGDAAQPQGIQSRVGSPRLQHRQFQPVDAPAEAIRRAAELAVASPHRRSRGVQGTSEMTQQQSRLAVPSQVDPSYSRSTDFTSMEATSASESARASTSSETPALPQHLMPAPLLVVPEGKDLPPCCKEDVVSAAVARTKKYDGIHRGGHAFIIACHNSSTKIHMTIENILLRSEPWQVFVADNGSSPEQVTSTAEACKQLSLDYNRSHPGYAGHPINFGTLREGSKTVAQFASVFNLLRFDRRIDYVTMIDDDTVVPASWSEEEVIAYFERNAAVKCLAYPLEARNQTHTLAHLEHFEYLLAGYMKIVQAKLGTTLFASGAFNTWRVEYIVDILFRHDTMHHGDDLQQGLLLHSLAGKSWILNPERVHPGKYKVDCAGSIVVATDVPVHWFHARDLLPSWLMDHCGTMAKCKCGEPSLFQQRAKGWEVSRQRFLWKYAKMLFAWRSINSWRGVWARCLAIYDLALILNDWAVIAYTLAVFLYYQTPIYLLRGLVLSWAIQLLIHVFFNLAVLWPARKAVPVEVMVLFPVLYKLPMLVFIRLFGMFYNLFYYVPFVRNKTKVRSRFHNRDSFKSMVNGAYRHESEEDPDGSPRQWWISDEAHLSEEESRRRMQSLQRESAVAAADEVRSGRAPSIFHEDHADWQGQTMRNAASALTEGHFPGARPSNSVLEATRGASITPAGRFVSSGAIVGSPLGADGSHGSPLSAEFAAALYALENINSSSEDTDLAILERVLAREDNSVALAGSAAVGGAALNEAHAHHTRTAAAAGGSHSGNVGAGDRPPANAEYENIATDDLRRHVRNMPARPTNLDQELKSAVKLLENSQVLTSELPANAFLRAYSTKRRQQVAHGGLAGVRARVEPAESPSTSQTSFSPSGSVASVGRSGEPSAAAVVATTSTNALPSVSSRDMSLASSQSQSSGSVSVLVGGTSTSTMAAPRRHLRTLLSSISTMKSSATALPHVSSNLAETQSPPDLSTLKERLAANHQEKQMNAAEVIIRDQERQMERACADRLARASTPEERAEAERHNQQLREQFREDSSVTVRLLQRSNNKALQQLHPKDIMSAVSRYNEGKRRSSVRPQEASAARAAAATAATASEYVNVQPPALPPALPPRIPPPVPPRGIPMTLHGIDDDDDSSI